MIRLGAVFLIAASAVVPLAGTASAAAASATDAINDATPTSDCHGDITSLFADYTHLTITTIVTLECPSEPAFDPGWVSGGTALHLLYDVDGDRNPDFDAVFRNRNHRYAYGPQAEVVNLASNTVGCLARAWSVQNKFAVSMPAFCINAGPSFNVQASMVWDENPGTGQSTLVTDRAPDGSEMFGPITNAAMTPPLGYHDACERSDQTADSFPDAGLAADCAKAWGLVLGQLDGSFGENGLLRRSQVASVLTRLLNTNNIVLPGANRTFVDVNPDTVPDSRVRDEIEQLGWDGIMVGFPDGTFRPSDTMSVAQATTFVVRTVGFVLYLSGRIDWFVLDEGDTSSNYQNAIAKGILDSKAADVHDTPYPVGERDAVERGLLADMLAQTLEKMGKIYVADCAEAHAAGVAPIAIGGPYYRPALDPDGDGVACNP